MKVTALLCGLCIAIGARGDGYFKFSKLGEIATIGYEAGPVADSTVFAQVFAGRSPTGMTAVGDPIPFTTGRIFPTLVDVPFMVPGETAIVSFSAWDSKSWGLSYNGVPPEGSVRSSILSAELMFKTSEVFFHIAFPEKIVVPTTVPEPSVLALAVLGVAGTLVWGTSFLRVY